MKATGSDGGVCSRRIRGYLLVLPGRSDGGYALHSLDSGGADGSRCDCAGAMGLEVVVDGRCTWSPSLTNNDRVGISAERARLHLSHSLGNRFIDKLLYCAGHVHELKTLSESHWSHLDEGFTEYLVCKAARD
jgi:hypothetical protein